MILKIVIFRNGITLFFLSYRRDSVLRWHSDTLLTVVIIHWDSIFIVSRAGALAQPFSRRVHRRHVMSLLSMSPSTSSRSTVSTAPGRTAAIR